MLKAKAVTLGLDTILSDKYEMVNSQHDAVAAEYAALVETPAQYDGIKAYPLKAKLTDLVSRWDGLIQEGTPIVSGMVQMGKEWRSSDANARAPSRCALA